MINIIHGFAIKAPITKVHDALTTLPGLAKWWTKDVSGSPATGGELDFKFCDPSGKVMGQMKMKVLNADGGEVKWRCVSGPEDWLGTTLEFHLNEEKGKTKVLFGHKGWKEANPHFAHCSMKWAVFMLSLKQLVETGAGRAFPNDIQIED